MNPRIEEIENPEIKNLNVNCAIISQNEKKRRKPHHGCSGVFFVLWSLFVVLKFVAFYRGVAAPVITIRAAKSLYEKTPDFSYTF